MLLSAGYKDTIEMEKIQDYYFSRFESMIAKRWAKSHGHPCEVPERKVEIVKKKQEVTGGDILSFLELCWGVFMDIFSKKE